VPTVIFLILMGGAIYPCFTQLDPFHIIMGGIAAVIIGIGYGSTQHKRRKPKEVGGFVIPIQKRSGGEPFAVSFVKGLGLALATYILATLIAFIVIHTPLVGIFYDADFLHLKDQISTLESAGSYEPAINLIDSSLQSAGRPKDQTSELNNWKYRLLIERGRVSKSTEEGKGWFKKAIDWATQVGINPELAQALYNGFSIPPTPAATATMYPTYTPFPTATFYPTYTPQATQPVSVAPTLPAGYLRCEEPYFIEDNTTPPGGKKLELWGCKNDLYQIIWYFQSGSEAKNSSSVVTLNMSATFFTSANHSFSVTPVKVEDAIHMKVN
jgi:hypothetical protein